MKRIIIDLDNTLTMGERGNYADAMPRVEIIDKLRDYRRKGFEIVVYTARNMRTYQNNIGKITACTSPVILDWLQRHDIPYDELWLGKPWCGQEGFYVDDKAVRPDEFAALTYDEIVDLLDLRSEG